MKFLLMAVVCNSVANVLLKFASNAAGTQPPVFGFIPGFALHPFFIAGIVCFAGGLLVYTKALETISLSIAYPMMSSFSFALVIVASVAYFKERLNLTQSAGLCLIVIGIILVSQNSK